MNSGCGMQNPNQCGFAQGNCGWPSCNCGWGNCGALVCNLFVDRFCFWIQDVRPPLGFCTGCGHGIFSPSLLSHFAKAIKAARPARAAKELVPISGVQDGNSVEVVAGVDAMEIAKIVAVEIGAQMVARTNGIGSKIATSHDIQEGPGRSGHLG